MKVLCFTIAFLFSFLITKGQQNPWFDGGVKQTLPQYVPMPIDALRSAGQAVQLREEAKTKATIKAHRELYSSVQYFKNPRNGNHTAILIFADQYIVKAVANVIDNRLQSLIIGDRKLKVSAELKITSEVKKAYNKAFLSVDEELIPIDIYFTDLYSVSPVPSQNEMKKISISKIELSGKKINSYQFRLKPSSLPINIYNVPDMGVAEAIDKIDSNTNVTFLEIMDSGFYKVQYEDLTGYIYKNSVERK